MLSVIRLVFVSNALIMSQKGLDTEIRQEEHSSQGVSSRLHFSKIIGRILSPLMGRVPVGYEDESGFHTEERPVSDSSS